MAEVQLLEMSIADAIDAAADRWDAAIGWVFEDQRISFAQMREWTDQAARAFIALGVEAGDVIAVWTPNLLEFALCEFACSKIGALVTAINTRSKDLEVAHTLKHSRAKVLVMIDGFLKHDFVATLESIGATAALSGSRSPDFPSLEHVLTLTEGSRSGARTWQSFVSDYEGVPTEVLRARQAKQSTYSPVLIQYTSGTTALPKGAVCNQRYVLNAGVELLQRMGIGLGEAYLNTQPFYHVGGSCAAIPAPLVIGCRMIIPEYYEAERIMQLIERERCVGRSGYGAMYVMEMNHPNFDKYDLSSLRTGWCVGTPALLERVREKMGIAGLVQIYGSTEVGHTCGFPEDPWSVRSTSCGRPLTGMEISILDPETSARLPPYAQGEVAMRGWLRMDCYLGDNAATSKAIDKEGWVHTGDSGYLDEAGNLYFCGRLKDMLKVGGENVSAEEVETFLLTHPSIVQCAVIGAADDRLEEVPMALVELKTNASITEKELIDYCVGKLANFRVPRYVRFVTDWPMTGSGKIQKNKLREIYLPPVPTPN